MDKAHEAATAAAPESFTVHRQRFSLAFDYPVYFTRALFSPTNEAFVHAITRLEHTRRHRFVAFLDEGLVACWPRLATDIAGYAHLHARHLELLATPQSVPAGEQAKNTPSLITELQRRLLDLGVDRHAYVVAIGGGAVLDAVGFVAATTHRGVRHIRVPTTVLSQNDSGIGVKNGVNAFGIKNFVGTFAPPFAVLNDLDFLTTLETRDKIAGMAEAVKVSLIRDRGFFEWLERQAGELRAFAPHAVEQLIQRCAELHLRHIATGGDPFELGSARPLDFGHWAAHKLETLSRHALRHGEAVAIGMALDTRYAVQQGLLGEGNEIRVCQLLERLGFRLWHPAMEQLNEEGALALMAGLREFREHLGGELTITLLTDIGRGIEVHEIDEAQVVQAMAWLKQRDGQR